MTGKLPGIGHFTPDGQYFIVTNLLWGNDIDLQHVGATHSYLSVIRFADAVGVDRQPTIESWQRLQWAAVPRSLPSVLIGQFVVSLNMEASYLPLNHPRRT